MTPISPSNEMSLLEFSSMMNEKEELRGCYKGKLIARGLYRTHAWFMIFSLSKRHNGGVLVWILLVGLVETAVCKGRKRARTCSRLPQIINPLKHIL